MSNTYIDIIQSICIIILSLAFILSGNGKDGFGGNKAVQTV